MPAKAENNARQENVGALFQNYSRNDAFFDEMFEKDGTIRKHYIKLSNYLQDFQIQDFENLNEYAKVSFFNQGITFNVYSEEGGTERIFPFDLFPRIIPNKEWIKIEQGVIQRNKALNLFISDLYNEKKILKDGIIPHELVFSSKYYNKYMSDFRPFGNVHVHIAGTDIIKHSDGEYYVLEDNLRCPSGVSYVLANRIAMKKTFPHLFFRYNIFPVNDYPMQLLRMMHSIAPPNVSNPTCVLLTPGMYNSAYYEHTFLAHQMGIQLVEGRDLFVDKNFVYIKTIYGPERVDVIYTRVDEDFLDPLVFRKDSLLGIPGIFAVFRAGNVSIINCPGNGVADDKAVYSYVPEIIKYYLNEEPILKNVPTYRCVNEKEMKYVLDNMEKMVVKPVDESGGYGVLIGNRASQKEIEDYKEKIKANPRKYIAQPIMDLSVLATYAEDTKQFEQRHIDLRVFCLMGKDMTYVSKGGLTRVALKRGSLIVNSSQGGGSKDTWAMEF
ncbi:MAG: circularly permuted type 2 ATP-grasp protein [Cytophagales bacterium]|nr:circularly permuted type 2 ATP-grasp protein [Cytophagales bacterium]MDW8383772.1 circularly permuted type 2 ATP-grasp protein [Flammeovirgaceae bacterium]